MLDMPDNLTSLSKVVVCISTDLLFKNILSYYHFVFISSMKLVS